MNDDSIKLSFIIPFYNSEKYICKCLDNLYQQDIPEKEYEIICVNDCSPDGTREIVLNYQNKHKNLRLLEHDTNKRQGEARNTGLRAAQGKYVWFIDPDDYIEENCIKELIRIVENENLDILNFWLYRDFDGQATPLESFAENTDVMTGANWLSGLKKNFDENGYCWSKICRTDFLLRNQLFFADRWLYDDQSFCLFAVYKANRFKHIDRNIYYYRCNPDSTLNRRFKSVHFVSSIECGTDYLNFYNEIKETDTLFAEKVKMSGLWKINFGCKEILYISRTFRIKLIQSLMPHLLLIKESGYFKGFSIYYFRYFSFFNGIFFLFSPLLRYLREIKRNLKRYKIKGS